MSDATVLCSSVSPNGNIQAVVEQDSRVVYFYLWPAPETNFTMKSCWVRNLVPAPEKLDVEGIRKGTPPLLPRGMCRHPDGASPLRAEDLRIVWFEEGNAAALFLGSQVLAIIPPWSGVKGFAGYAQGCVGESLLCWPLPTERHLLDRIERAEDFWRSWEEGEPWLAIRDAMASAYQSQIGAYSNYYAIDGGNWPPKALLRIPVPGGIALVTAGMCIRPQPSVETYTEDPASYRRIELGMCLGSAWPASAVEKVMHYLSGQTGYPWHFYSWLGHGHTFPCDAIPNGGDGALFPFVLLQKELTNEGPVLLPEYRGDPVSLLWMIPITQAERDFAMECGSDRLVRALVREGVGRVHQSRRQVDLETLD
jgi:hypothetical protein